MRLFFAFDEKLKHGYSPSILTEQQHSIQFLISNPRAFIPFVAVNVNLFQQLYKTISEILIRVKYLFTMKS